MTMRYALIRNSKEQEVAAYLPSNYKVLGTEGDDVLIGGEDNAGWTLDDYVLPRLASGLRFGQELSEAEGEAWAGRLETTTPREQLFDDLVIAAIEGGIGYWSIVTSYDPDQATAIVHDIAEDDTLSHPLRIDRAVVRRGYALAASTEWRSRIAWSTEPPPVVITAETDWDHDAGDADVIVQLGLFGDVVYG